MNTAEVMIPSSTQEMLAHDRAFADAGVHLRHCEVGSATVAMTVSDRMLNGHDQCHGGWLLLLADATFGCAANSHGPLAVSAYAQMNFISGATPGETLVARASLKSDTEEMDFTTCPFGAATADSSPSFGPPQGSRRQPLSLKRSRKMPRIVFMAPTGTQEIVDGAAGNSLMETAVQNGVPGIVGECGGAAACSTCHIYIDDVSGRDLPPISDLEDEMLDGVAAERNPSSRLACQIPVNDVLDGLIVRTPEEQR